MAHRPLYGHHALRKRLTASAAVGRLPASLLFQGQRGVGKQRLALWIGQYLLCERAIATRLDAPCGECQHCRYVAQGQHPDLHWIFPRPTPKDRDQDHDEVKAAYNQVIAERMKADGLWSPSSGSDGLQIAVVRALLKWASPRPAMAARKVFVVGDAERMVQQAGSDEAANAFLKLLEEPPPGTTIILTTSEPGMLLPTIKSRVVSVRVAALPAADVEAFLDDAAVQRALSRLPRTETLARAAGAPGELLASESTDAAYATAKRLLDAALQPSTPEGVATRIKNAAKLGVAGARGAFSDILESLTLLLHERARQLVRDGRDIDARRTASAVIIVERAKVRAQGNVSPQLLAASLLSHLHKALAP